jgi:hypothetical protein
MKIETTLRETIERDEMGAVAVALKEYAGSLCVEPETGLVVSDQWRASALYTAGEQQARIDLNAAMTLKETRRLSPGTVAARMKEAEVIDRVIMTAFPGEEALDRKQWIEETQRLMARFRREHPNSPYLAALIPIEKYLEPEARRLALQEKPAPAFRLQDLAGKEQTLGQYRGKLILLNFFASW